MGIIGAPEPPGHAPVPRYQRYCRPGRDARTPARSRSGPTPPMGTGQSFPMLRYVPATAEDCSSRAHTDHRLYKRRGMVGLGETPFFRQTTPSEQLARRQAVPPRRRRYNPRHAIAFRHDPLLFYQRPAPPRTCRDHIEPRNLRRRRMVSHTPMSSSKDLNRQGGPDRLQPQPCMATRSKRCVLITGHSLVVPENCFSQTSKKC